MLELQVKLSLKTDESVIGPNWANKLFQQVETIFFSKSGEIKFSPQLYQMTFQNKFQHKAPPIYEIKQ